MNAFEENSVPGGQSARRPPYRRPPVKLSGDSARAPSGQELSALIVRIGEARDRQAFTAVYAHFAPRVKSFLMRSGCTAAMAEELAQEAMVSLWAKAASYDPAKAGASTWVFTIARNLRIDYLRRQRPAEQIGLTLEEESDPSPDGEANLLASERDDTLREALANLSAEQATIVRLSFYQDKAHSEIARELGLPLGTVKSRVRLALARLRALLEERA